MKKELLEAFLKYTEGQREKHLANVKVYFENPTGIGEHSDIMEALEQEIEKVAKYDDMLNTARKYFT